MTGFQSAVPTPEGDWRHIVRFGRNVASYKFALGEVLLELGVCQKTFVSLADLAVPYAAALCRHLKLEDKQTTSAQSRFLDALRSHNRGELDEARLIETTVRLGFQNVIDAFHVSRDGQPVQHRFFADERSARGGITLTDDLLALAAGPQANVLPLEVEARWNLVEVSWGLGLGSRIVSFEMEPDADPDPLFLYAPRRLRRDRVTRVRDALSGYQNGCCAYCGTEFTDIGPGRVAVDHVIPFMLMSRGWHDGDLHQVWNFVLACWTCNSAKHDRPPAAAWMPWLEERTEQLIGSHHPLRETLIKQLGKNKDERYQTLARRYKEATACLRPWMPPRLPGR